ncbi:MAG: serine/threonine-protein phosphatase, partial [Mogibacterium sp.]|nr:serine/threonine-protein phosphatase [Mogibacterium sp.]
NQDNYFLEGHFRKINLEIDQYDQILRSPWTAAVFDGMGGEQDGEVASLVASALMKEFYTPGSGPDIRIDNLIMSINQFLCQEMEERHVRMGSTCVLFECAEDRIRSWNIGDSRAYLFRRGGLQQLSQDHTEAESMRQFADASSISSKAKSRKENSLTQHLGIPEDDFVIEPYVSDWFEAERGDYLLLCSDGLTHMVEDSEIIGILENVGSVRELCVQLLEAALAKGGLDNITILLAKCE